MKIRLKLDDKMVFELSHAGTVHEIEVGHLMSSISQALASDEVPQTWYLIDVVGQSIDLDNPGETLPAGGFEVPVNPTPEREEREAGIPEEHKTYKVWKVIGITADGRHGDFPIRAYDEEEFKQQLEELKAGGFRAERVVPPPLPV